MNITTVIVMAIFLMLLAGVGIYSKRFVVEADDFLLAGRELGAAILVFGVVASGFAGTTLTLAPGLGIRLGFWGTFGFAFFYAIVGVGLYAVLFAKTVRRSGAYTLPEWLEMRYSMPIRSMVSILATIAMIALTANNILSLANVIAGYFRWDLRICVVIGLVTVLVFTWCSGMWGISMTDFIQAGIGIVGAPVLLMALMNRFGGVGTALANWGGGSFNYMLQGASGTEMAFGAITYPSIITIGLNFSIFLVWGGQHYWMKMASARSENGARNAYIVGGIILFFITMIIGMVGLYAGSAFPEMFDINGGTLTPESAYGFVLGEFPAAIGAFLLIFALAASMSTAATNLLGAVSITTKDIYQRFINKDANPVQLTRASRVITLIVTGISWALSFYPGGTAFLFAFATAWLAPAGLSVFFGIYWRRATNPGCMAGAVCGTVFMSVWAFMNLLGIPFMGQPVASYAHMSVIGIVTTIIPFVLVSLFTQPKYYGAADWTAKGESDAVIDLTADDKRIMSYIRTGLDQMCELMDITAWSGEKLNTIIEKLDRNRYLCRESLQGEGFWSFSLTRKGEDSLPAMEAEDKELLGRYGLIGDDVHFLQGMTQETNASPAAVIRGLKDADDRERRREYALSVVKLIRHGYLTESGFLKRVVSITEKGKQVVRETKKAA